MLRLMASGLFEQFGINVETCEVSFTFVRKGDALELTALPRLDDRHMESSVEHFRQMMLADMEDGVAYVATGNATGPSAFAITVGGKSVPLEEIPSRVVEVTRMVVATAVGAIKTAARTFSEPVDLTEFVSVMSASSLRNAVNAGRGDLLVPGARPVACHCGECGMDRLGRQQMIENVGFATPTFACSNPYFASFAAVLEQAFAALLPEIELAQLRRLRIELAAEGLDLAVTLPDDDVGAPFDGSVLYSEPPPEYAPHRASLADALSGLLDGSGIVIAVVSLDDLDGLDDDLLGLGD